MQAVGALSSQPPRPEAASLRAPLAARADDFELLDERDEWLEFSRPLDAPPGGEPARWESTVVFDGMHCAACAGTIEQALRGTPGVRVAVEVLDVDASAIEVGLEVDREIQHSVPPRLFAGLLTQIEAVQTQEPHGRSLGRWRIAHNS